MCACACVCVCCLYNSVKMETVRECAVSVRECVNSVSQNGENGRERECAISAGHNGKNEFLEDKSIYRQSLSCSRLQMLGTKIKVADVVVSTHHVTFLTNRFPRLISLPTSAIFVSGTNGITAILKYRNVNAKLHITNKFN